MTGHAGTTRREFLKTAAGTAAGSVLITLVSGQVSRATPEAMQHEIRKITGGAAVKSGRVKLDIPVLIENGNTVAMSINVDSPMTPEDYVKAIHVFNEKNPQPHILSVKLSPRSGRAAISSRIRLADSQNIIAIAEMNDGSFWSGDIDVIVTIAACLEDL